MPPKKTLVSKPLIDKSKQSITTIKPTSSRWLVSLGQIPSPKPIPPKQLSWYKSITKQEEEQKILFESYPNLSIEELANLAKANPTLISMKIFQKAVEETFQKTLQQMDWKQKSIVGISDPTPS